MKGAKHFVVPKERFELVQGQDSLTLYQVSVCAALSSSSDPRLVEDCMLLESSIY